PDHVVDAHLHHLGAAGEAHLHAGLALAAGEAALKGRELDGVAFLDRDPRELGNRLRLLLRLVELLREAVDIRCHYRALPSALPSRSFTRSSATLTIMSSCPPTMRRLPSSTRMSRVSMP